MFGRNIKMKCGHYADTIMTDVPYHNEHIDIAACSFCFVHTRDAIQPACNMDESKPSDLPITRTTIMEYTPYIDRDRTIPILGAIAIVVMVIALIASI